MSLVLTADGTFLGQIGQPSEITGEFCPVEVAVDANGNLVPERLRDSQSLFLPARREGRLVHLTLYGLCWTPSPPLSFSIFPEILYSPTVRGASANSPRRLRTRFKANSSLARLIAKRIGACGTELFFGPRCPPAHPFESTRLPRKP